LFGLLEEEGMNYAEKAAQDLSRMFARQTPHELVSSGRCSLNDWLRALDARRDEFQVSFSNQAQAVKYASVSSHARSLILKAISNNEALKTEPLKVTTLEREVLRLEEDGMIERLASGLILTRRGERALNALRQQSTKPIPFQSVRPTADQAQINAA
jgi:hypothetical protein